MTTPRDPRRRNLLDELDELRTRVAAMETARRGYSWDPTTGAVTIPGLAVDWQDYTPGWSGTIGNGTREGRWCRVGDLIVFRAFIQWGSTTTHPGGATGVDLPVPAAFPRFPVAAHVRDSSANAEWAGVGRFATGSTVSGFRVTGNTTAVNATHPFTWADGDSLWVAGTYEAA